MCEGDTMVLSTIIMSQENENVLKMYDTVHWDVFHIFNAII